MARPAGADRISSQIVGALLCGAELAHVIEVRESDATYS